MALANSRRTISVEVALGSAAPPAALAEGVVDRFAYHGGLDRAVGHIVENFAALAPTRTPAVV